MSWIIHDPDEFESVVEVGPPRRDPFGNEIGSVAYTQRRRDPEEVKRIKEERRRKEEDRILAEAEAIRARRGTPPERNSQPDQSGVPKRETPTPEAIEYLNKTLIGN